MNSTPRAYDHQPITGIVDRCWQWCARRLNWSMFGRILWVLFRTLFVMGICYIIVFPLLSKFATSFMSRSDIWDQAVTWIPKYGTLVNYYLAWEYMQYPTAFMNSLGLSLMVSVLQMTSCTLVGYGFARFPFFGHVVLFPLVILTLVIPPHVIMVPLYLTFRYFNAWGLAPTTFNLINTYWPLVLLSLTGTALRNGLFIYVMRQFFRGIPLDLEEAAYVDGAGALRTFLVIMLPAAVPGLVIIFLFAFVWQWNDYFMTNMLMARLTLLPTMLDNLPDSVFGQDHYMIAEEVSLLVNTGSLMLIAPLVLVYLFLQRYFIESVERTGLGGG